jgi:hypothetical protein
MPQHRQQPCAFPAISAQGHQESFGGCLALCGEQGQDSTTIAAVERPVAVRTEELGVLQIRCADLTLGDESECPALLAGVPPRRLELRLIIAPVGPQVVAILHLVEHRLTVLLVSQPNVVVDKHIWCIGPADPCGITVRNGDGLLLKLGHGSVKVEEHVEIALKCRLKRNSTLAPEVDHLASEATGVPRNNPDRHWMKPALKVVSIITVKIQPVSLVIVHNLTNYCIEIC